MDASKLKQRKADLKFELWFSRAGYEVHISAYGKKPFREACRDWGGSHRTSTAVHFTIDEFDKLLGKMRDKL